MLTFRRALNDPERRQDVIGHRLIFCEAARDYLMEDLLLECQACRLFLAYCCCCANRLKVRAEASRRQGHSLSLGTGEGGDKDPPPTLCHHYSVTFIDGACLGNGQLEAKAGIGIALGSDPETMQWAIPIDDTIDPFLVRTSQRAELLAAIHGIRKLAEYNVHNWSSRSPNPREKYTANQHDRWIIVSDSEYVVLGMTEWMPAWESKGWRNSSGKKPKNLDLFQTLDETVRYHERKYAVRIGFFHVGRAHNELADSLAGSAAKGHKIEPVQFQHKAC